MSPGGGTAERTVERVRRFEKVEGDTTIATFTRQIIGPSAFREPRPKGEKNAS